MFICIGAPLLLMLFLLEKQSRVTVGYMILGIVMCLFAGEVNALLMQLLRLNLQYAAVSLTPITEEIIKALPVLFYAFVISEKWERLLSLSMALGISLEDGDDWCVGSVSIDNGEVYTYNQWLEEGEQITINLTKDTTYSGSGFFSFFGFFGSMVSSGSIWIIVGIAVALAAAAVITVIVVKKRKKTAG